MAPTAQVGSSNRLDAVIVGGGVAGLTTAIELTRMGRRVALVTKGRFGSGGSTEHAQGGIAAAIGRGDTPASHARDTVAVGAGLSKPHVAATVSARAAQRIDFLLELGAALDRAPDGRLALGREAGHSRHRIVHAAGDQIGRELMRVLMRTLAHDPRVAIHEHHTALDLLIDDERRVGGLLARDKRGALRILHAPSVVLATGGIGQLYAFTTNPPEVTGDGLALAARAGARLIDLEMVQFHPTALALDARLGAATDPRSPLWLISEAVRGEGALLVDETGRRFMKEIHTDGELAPRDIVARSIWRELERGHRVLLDARAALGQRFADRFPSIDRACRRAGVNPATEPIPVRPAAHYHMGGIEVDANGRSSIDGLWAVGEASCTGLHGANRLASNSLLEGLVYGELAAHAIDTDAYSVTPRRLMRPRHPKTKREDSTHPEPVRQLVERLRGVMWRDVGLVRHRSDIERALREIDAIDLALDGRADEARSLLQSARLVAGAALLRAESCGAHYLADGDEPPRPPNDRRYRVAYEGGRFYRSAFEQQEPKSPPNQRHAL